METSQDKEQPKLQLDYPAQWKYKIVGRERAVLEEAVKSVVSQRLHSINFSNKSSGGKYVSLNLDMIVQNEEERNFIYEALKAHQDIQYVL